MSDWAEDDQQDVSGNTHQQCSHGMCLNHSPDWETVDSIGREYEKFTLWQRIHALFLQKNAAKEK